MAVDRLVVLKAIEEKFKGKSLTKNFKENLATKWAEKIEDEDGINDYIEDREDIIIEANAEADRRAIAAAKKAKGTKVEVTEEKEEEDLTGVPDWGKALIKSNNDLNEKIAGFEAGNKAKTIKDKFFSDERVKDIPDFIRNGYIPTSEEDFEEKVSSLAESYKDFATKHKLQNLGNDTPASAGKTDPLKVKEATDEEINDLINVLK